MKLVIDISEEVLKDIDESTYPNDRIVSEVIYAVKNGEKQTNTAEWIDDDDHLSENTECSICNFYMLKEFKKRCKYCPNCGARMKESEVE